ncbi:hypothetical protein Poli38472_008098 [Pythium oligandrum]|uniref:Uncharacterized protein n=1 Tax=Pythium oligandrum TaxID=41045 RepID=A0A8K1CMN7_PYTOL|nr:hypothetical protein Poli38472_008098 [Pythium oligandrum]|eukprot:TMW65456.1 hypothetical protein Poli38472_008098 [Pythium oligandrum]
MAITKRVKESFVDPLDQDGRLIRLAPNAPKPKRPSRRMGTPWTHEEHDRFLEAMELFPSGPWKVIAEHVGTRSTRQTMTHAQKYRQKVARWKQLNGQTQPEPVHSHIYTCNSMMPAMEHSTGLEDESVEFWAMLEQLLSDDTPMSDEDEDDLVGLLNNYEPLHLTGDGVASFDVMDGLAGPDDSLSWVVDRLLSH